MTAARGDRSPDRTTVLPDLLLLLVHLALAASFVRLYEGPFFGELAAFVVAAAVTAFAARRLQLPAALVAVLPLAGAVLVSTWILFGETTTGGLPTSATWEVAGEALREARTGIEVLVAPAEVLVGFQLVAGLALWSSVWFADWAAFRLRTPVEAVVPATVIFVFGAVLGSGEHQIWTSIAFGATCLLFIAAHRADEARRDQAWIAADARGSRSLLRVGAALTVVGVLAGTLLGPAVPGSDSDPVVGWRDDSDGPQDRVALSPIVDLRRRLVDQTDRLLFTVAADRPAYWRTTSLDQFDGQLWTSGGTFRMAESSLGSSDDAGPRSSLMSAQSYEMDVLGSIFLPAAFEPRTLTGSTEPLRWDSESSTLIVDSSVDSVNGIAYSVESAIPAHSADELRTASGPEPSEVSERFTALPSNLPPEVSVLAAEVTSAARTRYDRALALQNWFRSEFEYSVHVPPGHDDDAISAFLRDRVGYCEQFAGTFAAMARSLGIPARVAIGFTPGEADPDRPGTYLVRGRHAHAWPEVWIPEVGWVAFEPTPGRGMPDAEAYTGVQPQQEDDGPTSEPLATTTTTAAPQPVPGQPTSTTTTTTSVPSDAATPIPPDQQERGGGSPRWLPWLGGGVLLVAAWVGAALWLPARRRRRAAGAEPATAILASWREASGAVARLTGIRHRPYETHEEVALRVRAQPGPSAIHEPFEHLAALATTAAWSPTALGEDQRDLALRLSDDLRRQTAERRGPLRRLLHRLSWRTITGRG